MSRARTELEVAQLLAERGYPEQAASRVFYAAFYAADAALLNLGEKRSSHSGLVAAFGRLVVKEGGFDPGTGALLHRLFELRSDADDGSGTVTTEQVRSALASAERLVAAVEEWLNGMPVRQAARQKRRRNRDPDLLDTRSELHQDHSE